MATYRFSIPFYCWRCIFRALDYCLIWIFSGESIIISQHFHIHFYAFLLDILSFFPSKFDKSKTFSVLCRIFSQHVSNTLLAFLWSRNLIWIFRWILPHYFWPFEILGVKLTPFRNDSATAVNLQEQTSTPLILLMNFWYFPFDYLSILTKNFSVCVTTSKGWITKHAPCSPQCNNDGNYRAEKQKNSLKNRNLKKKIWSNYRPFGHVIR